MVAEEPTRLLQRHYAGGTEHTGADLYERIIAFLRASGADLDHLTLSDLAPIDQFHTGGQEATRALLEQVTLRADMEVLDVGGGLGGPARQVASSVGCRVAALDMTEAYCRVGALLTHHLGLSDRVTFWQGDALAMPFVSERFDVVWLQNVAMNVADKTRLFGEIHRVLRPGGVLALQDVLAGPIQPIHFPVPWARDASQSHLWSPDAMRSLLADTGFAEVRWVVLLPPESAMTDRPSTGVGQGLPAFHVLLGNDYPAMARNSQRNRIERRTIVVQVALRRL